jgi:hypothetical protein
MNLVVNNPEHFTEFLTAIIKIIPSHKFDINSDGCTIRSVNEYATVRGFFKTQSITSDSDVSFCLSDTTKLLRIFQYIKDLNKPESLTSPVTLEYDNTFLRYNKNGMKFKFSTIKDQVIEKFITNDLTTQLTDVYGLNINSDIIKKILSMSSITSTEDPKLYLYKEGEVIVGEVDDKTNRLTDSIAIPISKNYFGDWNTPISIKLDIFRLFGIIHSDEIKVALTDKKVLEVNSTSSAVQMRLIANILKR